MELTNVALICKALGDSNRLEMCIRDRFMEVNEGRDLRDKSSVKAVTRKVIT